MQHRGNKASDHEARLRAAGEKFPEEDIEPKVLRQELEIKDRFRKGPLKKFAAKVDTLFALLKDYVNGRYLEVPYWVVGATAVALLYVFLPGDAIPDFIPLIGYIDDAAVMASCLAMIDTELESYITWSAGEVE
ncbi:MAG: DUF1232 domain-containing protein [Fidelibacterota bacterium]|nr:MAG: DUF1232 domain-containing protein [Candidatus Neomarinimicrobiota bacterium]